MFDVGGGELLLIVLAVLVLFGPKKIPEVAAMIGKGMRKVRQAQDDFTQHMRDLSTDLEHVGEKPSVPGTVVPSLSPTSTAHSFVDAEILNATTPPEHTNGSVQSDATVNTTLEPHLSSAMSPSSENDFRADEQGNALESSVPSPPKIQPAPGSISR